MDGVLVDDRANTRAGNIGIRPEILADERGVAVTKQHCHGEVRVEERRRGRVLGMDTRDGMQIITASVPQAELFTYATELRSLTGGRGTFSAVLDRYEDVPSHIAEKVIEAHRKVVEAAHKE